MNHLEAGRIFMGDSLAFHIIFALLGVGLPLMISIFEFMAIRRKDNSLREATRLWSYISGVLVVTGVLSGTVVALQMFLIWPGILNYGGKAIAPAFMLEGYAFIIEAVFLAFYLKTWDKLKGYAHWVLSLPIVFGAGASAFLITAVDAWMNHPTGFTVLDGKVTDPHPWQAIFNMTSYLESTHSILGYYLTATLVIMGAYAVVLLRKKKAKPADVKTAKFIMQRTAIMAVCFLAAIAVYGDLSGKYLATYEPTKLAAIELRDTTTTNAPLIIGGTPQNDGSAKGGVAVPGLLSFVVGNNTSTTVQGLDATPQNEWPPLVIHTLFDFKLLLIALLLVIPVTFLYGLYRAKKFAFSKGMLVTTTTLPFISLAVIELGWMVTELGRQPYSVYGYQLTSEVYTKSQGVLALAWLFPVAYVVLLVVTLAAIKITINNFKPATVTGRK
jgi:cytochrome d ubiquinol oxidase subunit I